MEATSTVVGDSLFTNVSSSRMRSSRASRKVGKGRLQRRRTSTWLKRSWRPRITLRTKGAVDNHFAKSREVATIFNGSSR